MLSHSSLPPSLIPKCLDVLLKGTSERDFMRIVVEIVQSLRADSTLVTSESEGEVGSEAEEEARARRVRKGKGRRGSPARDARRKDLDLRCLVVVKALLERVMGVSSCLLYLRGEGTDSRLAQALQQNSMLHGLVAELIVPAVKTKDEEVRAEGLICLGLVCLLDKVRRYL